MSLVLILSFFDTTSQSIPNRTAPCIDAATAEPTTKSNQWLSVAPVAVSTRQRFSGRRLGHLSMLVGTFLADRFLMLSLPHPWLHPTGSSFVASWLLFNQCLFGNSSVADFEIGLGGASRCKGHRCEHVGKVGLMVPINTCRIITRILSKHVGQRTWQSRK